MKFKEFCRFGFSIEQLQCLCSQKQQLVNRGVSCSTLSLAPHRFFFSFLFWSKPRYSKCIRLDQVWESCRITFPTSHRRMTHFQTLFMPTCPCGHLLCSLNLVWMRQFICSPRIHPTACRSIYLSLCLGLCSLTRVWFQAESTPCKTSRSQRLRGGSREGRGGARPGFIPGRVQCSGVRSGPWRPWARRRDGWVDLLTDDCVSPEAGRHRSQQVEQGRDIDLLDLTSSCITQIFNTELHCGY